MIIHGCEGPLDGMTEKDDIDKTDNSQWSSYT